MNVHVCMHTYTWKYVHTTHIQCFDVNLILVLETKRLRMRSVELELERERQSAREHRRRHVGVSMRERARARARVYVRDEERKSSALESWYRHAESWSGNTYEWLVNRMSVWQSMCSVCMCTRLEPLLPYTFCAKKQIRRASMRVYVCWKSSSSSLAKCINCRDSNCLGRFKSFV